MEVVVTTEEKQRISRLCRMAGNIADGICSVPTPINNLTDDEIADRAVKIAIRIEDKVKSTVGETTTPDTCICCKAPAEHDSARLCFGCGGCLRKNHRL